MTELPSKQHGLESTMRAVSGTAVTNAGIRVSVLTDLAHINLRGDARDRDFLARAEKLFKQSLPLTANSVQRRGEQRIFWLGPDEWLIVLSNDERPDVATLAFANDISGGQLVLRLTGTAVEQVLAKGCTLNLAKEEFTVGSCAQAGLAKASVLIARMDDAGSFDIVVRRSFAEYLVKWLHRAGSEFGIVFDVA